MKFKMPSSIALELVPRDLNLFLDESRLNLDRYPFIQKINVPEIRSVEIKSFEASKVLLEHSLPAVPHFRLIDRTLDDLLKKLSSLQEMGLKEVLLIGGDPPKNGEFVPSGLTTLEAISQVRKAFPSLKIYAGLDPYRSSFRRELDYAKQKLDAGCNGFYTQPFFSLKVLDLWLEQLSSTELWFGISPVHSDKSRKYWEKVNQVVFPADFSYGVKENIDLAKVLLNRIAEVNCNAYFMPITISASDYLKDLFAGDDE
ncbi:MAG TPA: methylenetetrahydrofolate reductase [Fibrobacteraceae bacterium]|jgi:methylenetetrahydrofolate reductase (NADPH)|nr:methylenetetrahydrofolate reductase [Fibrobacter sp.]HPW94748.1 methylenetetrahydrofolate reductase [Fibrobacteraceae bacterium]